MIRFIAGGHVQISSLNSEDETSPDDFEILAHQRSGEDLAALVNHLHHLAVLDPDSDALSRIIKLARSAPKNPAVILQVALALHETNPADAMKALQSVLQQNPFSKNPTIAFCNILLARIGLKLGRLSAAAHEAVEAALEFWPDEPFWHSSLPRYISTPQISTAPLPIYRQLPSLTPRTSPIIWIWASFISILPMRMCAFFIRLSSALKMRSPWIRMKYLPWSIWRPPNVS